MSYPSGLPIVEIIPEIRSALASSSGVVIEAPPGAGKTTVVPLALVDEPWLSRRKVIILEPRRIAARAAAVRMSGLLGGEVGGVVGYRTRLDTRVSARTRIEVVTEGVLTRMLQSDPSLEGVGLVIFDEFHERSLQADLGLALTIEARSLFGCDLKIIVMSATIDGAGISALMGGVPVVKSAGKTFPVALRYLPERERFGPGYLSTGPAFVSMVTGAVRRTIKEEDGGVLVFLPGAGEIRRVEAALREGGIPEDTDLVPLYGDLSREAQDRAILPAPPGRRKVVLSTSIAETSLTIEGIRVVVDGGLKRVPRFSPSTGMGSLETVRVTKDSAAQRAGRAGRTGPGVAVRLWTESEQGLLKDKSTPEVLEADLSALALDLAAWGVDDPLGLKWLDPPPPAAMAQAREVLIRLGALDSSGRITAHGRELSGLPLHPRLAHMVLKGREKGLGGVAAHLAALLSERDTARGEAGDADARTRLEAVTGQVRKQAPIDRGLFGRIRIAAERIKNTLGIRDRDAGVDSAGLLLAFAYPERVGKLREGATGRYLLANGRGAYLERHDPLASEEYIVAANLDGGDRESRIFLAAPVTREEIEDNLKEYVSESEEVVWDNREKAVSARKRRSYLNITLEERRLDNPPGDKVVAALLEGVKENGLHVLPWDKASEGIRQRAAFLNSVKGLTGREFPDLSDGRILEDIEGVLGPWAGSMTRLEHLKRLDMPEVILSLFSWDDRQALDRLAPTHVTVPSGSRIALDYGAGRPVLKVRLQEVFGLKATPLVAGGRVKVLIHLLSPAFRPVQVTEDLEGFWMTGYEAVKKELKGRYPKHYWPDDPMEAEAVRGVRKRQ